MTEECSIEKRLLEGQGLGGRLCGKRHNASRARNSMERAAKDERQNLYLAILKY